MLDAAGLAVPTPSSRPLAAIHAACAATANVLARSAPHTEPDNLHALTAVIDMPTQRAESAICMAWAGEQDRVGSNPQVRQTARMSQPHSLLSGVYW